MVEAFGMRVTNWWSITGGALMQEPDLLLADDPTSSLDLKISIEILELISRRASESSIPAIVNNHNVELAPLRRPLDGLDGIVVGHPSI
jgi:ABC-type molybdate transport system ATPase subunit